MKAMILAAGLGTRLKPWTEKHPKALVPVAGVPMLERVIHSLASQGFDEIVVNVHHFASQIIDYLKTARFENVSVEVSDESGLLLDTGGGIVHAVDKLCADNRPFLVHNVDILTDADLRSLMERHESGEADATLLVSNRDSSRKLLADDSGKLVGWHNLNTDAYRPAGFIPDSSFRELAFSGIYALSPSAVAEMKSIFGDAPFPVMDFFLNERRKSAAVCDEQTFSIIDIGKPESLRRANELFMGEASSNK